MRRLFALLLLLPLSPLWAEQADDPRAHAAYYIDIYGEVNPDQDKRVQRAYEIFERVRTVAEDPIGFTPTLKVINSDAQPWAISLPDGYVILSYGALSVCYDHVDPAQGDARLAFVLGHELAHLVSRDFWHRNVFLSLSGTTQPETLSEVQEIVADELFTDITTARKIDTSAIKRKELHADDAGFLYASLAGFKTPLIFRQKGESRDFLQEWVRQTRTMDDSTHLGPEARSAFLQARFNNITHKVGIFNAAVLLAHFGHFRDAQYLFEAFAQSFPSHEVATNLGYVHLQQALQLMPKSKRAQYWLPAKLLDLPNLQITTRTLAGGLPPAARRHLLSAAKYLQKAAMARNDDISSRLNLAVVYFYLQEYYKARDRIEEARALDENNPDVLTLRALILNAQEKDIDMWPVATRILGKLARQGHLPARFNLARLYQARGRNAEARKLYLSLRSQAGQLPPEICAAMYRALHMKAHCGNPATANHSYPEHLIAPDLLAGFRHPETLKPPQWQKDSFQAGPLYVAYFHDLHNNAIFLLDHQPQLFVAPVEEKLSTRVLLEKYGQPVEKQSLGTKVFWRYSASWGAMVENGQISSIQGIAY